MFYFLIQGNGTQEIFYESSQVLYISIHRYDNCDFYPYLPSSDYMFTGKGEGVGKNVNIPWPCSDMGDSEYAYAFEKVVIPLVYKFNSRLPNSIPI